MRSNVQKWISSVKKYFFNYRDGFFEIPFLANSPELIVESFGNMPFMKNYPENNYFTTNNLFLSGDGHYQKIEDGLWLIISNMDIKKNVSFKLYYDPSYEADYHFLTLFVNRSTKKIKLPKIEFDIDFQDRTWTLYKANSKCINSHFAGQKSIYFSIYFSQTWLEENLAQNGIFKNDALDNFFSSNNKYLYLPNLLEGKQYLYENIIDKILTKEHYLNRDIFELKGMTFELMNSFLEVLDQKSFNQVSNNVSEKDKRLVLKVQHILEQSIFEKFPSIEFLARKVGVSTTKLKSDFKKINGRSIFQFYTMRQMFYAKEILQKEQITIKELAFTFGYSNQGKFSLAFKKVHGFLPSEIQN